MTNKIKLAKGFNPDRISGDIAKLNELGIILKNETKSEYSIMWDFEFPEIKSMKTREFKNVEIN